MIIIPYKVDVPMVRWPGANVGLIVATVLISAVILFGGTSFKDIEPYILNGWHVSGLVGHLFIHAGIIHLVGNMFLWVFGNAICAKVGNIAYPFIYLLLGFSAAVTHIAAAGTPAIGASGAINGVVGMFLVWYPLNRISCLYWLFFYRHGQGYFTMSSFWMILFWLVFDIWGAAAGSGRVAYWAHLGGFAAGAALASLLLKCGAVKMEPDELSLFDILAGRR